MVGLRAELENMNQENKQLKAMLNQVNNNYSALQMHIATIMQRQHNRRAEISQPNEVIIFTLITIEHLLTFYSNRIPDTGGAIFLTGQYRRKTGREEQK